MYTIYKEFACYHSPVLDKAFNGPFIEGQTKNITLDGFEYPSAFGLVQAWMLSPQTALQFLKEDLSFLYIIWILADRLLMPKLQNAVINELNSFGRHPLYPMPKHDWLEWLVSNTAPDAGIWRLYVDKLARCCTEGTFEMMMENEETPMRLV